jgi:hypothetical protein
MRSMDTISELVLVLVLNPNLNGLVLVDVDVRW